MVHQLLSRIAQGLSLIQQGKAIADEVRENIADGKEVLSESDLDTLNAKLDEVMAESEALSARIQRA